MKTPRERYKNDPAFHMLVDTMVKFIIDAKYTPSEMRDAALLATILYEQTHCTPRIYPPDVIEWLGGGEKVMKTPRERYKNDPAFHMLVDTMVKFIIDANEMRDAVSLATILYEQTHCSGGTWHDDMEECDQGDYVSYDDHIEETRKLIDTYDLLISQKDARIEELEESSDSWKREWRLAEDRIKELEEKIRKLGEDHDQFLSDLARMVIA